jgi:hypothetical protein
VARRRKFVIPPGQGFNEANWPAAGHDNFVIRNLSCCRGLPADTMIDPKRYRPAQRGFAARSAVALRRTKRGGDPVSVVTRAAALIAAFLIVVGVGVFVVVYYIGSATTQLPIVHYTASGGQVSVVLQEDPQNDSASRPDWVTYYTQDPVSKQWLHTTLFSVPANTKVNVTIYGYDGCTPLRNNFFSQVQGTIGGTVTVSQFDQNGKEYVTNDTTSVINSYSNCNVGHTFAIPDLGIYVPVASPNANLSANNLCGTSPCTPQGNPYATETFSFMSPSQTGTYRWQCLIPCGGGYIDGNGGPMQTLGWMMGEMDVVS